MGQIVCISNQKGGVGKTTTAVNLSAALAIAEKKTLIVDSDPQGHATTALGIDKRNILKSLYNGLMGDVSTNKLIVDSEIDLLKIIPSRTELIRSETELYSKDEKELVLRNLLKEQKEHYDYIIIDCPPSLNLLTANALAAADSLLIPLQCEFFAVESLGQMIKVFRLFKKRFNPQIRIKGILLNMYSENEVVSRHIAGDAIRHFNGMVFKSRIPRSLSVMESACYGKPILLRDIGCIESRCYLDLANEIINSNSGIRKQPF